MTYKILSIRPELGGKMFGIRYIKMEPNTYLLQYKNGKVVREGAGLSFYYFSPASSIVAVP
jgi:hypothetical protein